MSRFAPRACAVGLILARSVLAMKKFVLLHASPLLSIGKTDFTKFVLSFRHGITILVGSQQHSAPKLVNVNTEGQSNLVVEIIVTAIRNVTC